MITLVAKRSEELKHLKEMQSEQYLKNTCIALLALLGASGVLAYIAYTLVLISGRYHMYLIPSVISIALILVLFLFYCRHRVSQYRFIQGCYVAVHMCYLQITGDGLFILRQIDAQGKTQHIQIRPGDVEAYLPRKEYPGFYMRLKTDAFAQENAAIMPRQLIFYWSGIAYGLDDFRNFYYTLIESSPSAKVLGHNEEKNWEWDNREKEKSFFCHTLLAVIVLGGWPIPSLLVDWWGGLIYAFLLALGGHILIDWRIRHGKSKKVSEEQVEEH